MSLKLDFSVVLERTGTSDSLEGKPVLLFSMTVACSGAAGGDVTCMQVVLVGLKHVELTVFSSQLDLWPLRKAEEKQRSRKQLEFFFFPHELWQKRVSSYLCICVSWICMRITNRKRVSPRVFQLQDEKNAQTVHKLQRPADWLEVKCRQTCFYSKRRISRQVNIYI